MDFLDEFIEGLYKINTIKERGSVSRISGLLVESRGPNSSIGELCKIIREDGTFVYAEVVGVKENKLQLMVLGELRGIAAGSPVIAMEKHLSIKISEELLGRVVDGLGNVIDGNGAIVSGEERIVYNEPPMPLSRPRIKEPIATGVRAIDGVLTVGMGQRLGIFAGSGVGKSTLMGMIAKNTSADINVIALIGERGREVREFIERDLGEEGLKRSVVVVATSDRPALERIKSVFVAFTIAEYFRDKGKNVLLMMDSITRFSMAQREVGLSIGEPPSTKGYTPSVFALMPKVLERAATSEKGSITGLFTVLVEADDVNDPIGDTARSILDGHIVLSRSLAAKSHYPPIDIMESVSRVMPDVVTEKHLKAAMKIRELKSIYEEAEDLINIGAYVEGSNPKIDVAKRYIDEINKFLKQGRDESSSLKETVEILENIYDRISKDEKEMGING